MRPGGGKAKGSAFEREVCRILSCWVSHGEREDLFWRSAMSGGRATVAHRKGNIVRQVGDICAVTPEGHALTDNWFIECKHVRKLGLDHFLVKNRGPLATFWQKCMRDAANHNREPVLIAKQNGWPELLIARREVFIDFNLIGSIYSDKLGIVIGNLLHNSIEVRWTAKAWRDDNPSHS